VTPVFPVEIPPPSFGTRDEARGAWTCSEKRVIFEIGTFVADSCMIEDSDISLRTVTAIYVQGDKDTGVGKGVEIHDLKVYLSIHTHI